MLAASAGRGFVAAADLASRVDGVAYEVAVTNTGAVDADDVVLGFVVPPGAGEDGAPLQELFGFERVHVKAGETVSVWLYPTLAHFTAVTASGARAVRPGESTVRFGVRASAERGMGFLEHRLTAVL